MNTKLEDEVVSNGGGARGKKLLKGDSSRGGKGGTDQNELMEVQAPEVIELDLSKAQAAMKIRWLAVGYSVSVLAFSTAGLFRELKSN